MQTPIPVHYLWWGIISTILSNLMNSCLIPKMFIMDAFPQTHLIRNNVIHVSHMFLMKLNLEECGLWWEAAMICEVCVVEGQQGDRSLWGDFPLCTTNLFTYSGALSPSFFHSFTPMCFKCLCMSIFVFVNKHAWIQYLLLAATMYMAKYLNVSQAFRPSLVPTVRPLTHGSQPILSSYRMRQCRTWGG